MVRNLREWKGCFSAIVTPFKRDGEIDEDKFCENIELLIDEGIHGIVVAGCTGESWALLDEEHNKIFKLAVKTAKNKITVIGGTGQITPQHTIKLSKYAKEAGMDGVMILAPARVRPNNREIIGFFKDISDSINIPILVYNIPKRQGIDITPDLLLELSKIKNVKGVKESSDDYMRVLSDIRLCGNKINILTGHSAVRGVPSILMGAVGWVSSVETQIMGKEAIDMYNLVKNGKLEEARKIQYKCIELDEGLRTSDSGTFPAFLKYAMNLLNRPGGFLRRPILELTDEQKSNVSNLLKKLKIL
jgi:4-hydroxy-tetrahydrodipicolinate synthase